MSCSMIKDRRKIMKWEYLVEDAVDDYFINTNELDKLGEEGWELINIIKAPDGLFTCIYKRPKNIS